MILPKRIQVDLEELQYKSEMLVAIVQCGIILLLAAIYFSSPSGHAPDAPVRSAPLGLGLFAILVLVRFWFAYSRQLTPLFLGFSVTAEMSLLMFTIWTYHLQFEAMNTVNIKNTHINYVFVLIALRGLRFEPIWVILSGITAAIGWIVMVTYTLYEAGSGIITWDYVTYVSTRSLHPGGEFDKILTILLITGITAYTLKRGRDTLLTAVSKTQATKDLSKFFDSDVASKITASEEGLASGQGEIRHCAIIFTDMRGFTNASTNLSPTELITLLSEYQKLLIPIIRKHGGNIDKFMGDGILASFGAVSPSDTYAADVMCAVDDIQQATKDWCKIRQSQGLLPIGIGAGVAVGDVVCGVIGHEERLEYTVIGETVNLAAKLEKHNKAENAHALTTKAALDTALTQGYQPAQPKEIRPQRDVSGVGEPVDIAVLA